MAGRRSRFHLQKSKSFESKSTSQRLKKGGLAGGLWGLEGLKGEDEGSTGGLRHEMSAHWYVESSTPRMQLKHFGKL